MKNFSLDKSCCARVCISVSGVIELLNICIRVYYYNKDSLRREGNGQLFECQNSLCIVYRSYVNLHVYTTVYLKKVL